MKQAYEEPFMNWCCSAPRLGCNACKTLQSKSEYTWLI